jgi:hypothetical protein
VVAVTLCFAALVARTSLAAPLSADLSVTLGPGAEDCPDRLQLGAEIETILERPLSVPTAAGETLLVEVDFTRQGDRYQAALRLRGAKTGERLLDDHGSTCAALAEAAGVTLALLLDQELERPPRPPPPAEAPQAQPKPPAAAAASTRGWLSFLAGPAFGLVPMTSLGVGAAVGLDRGPFWIEIAGRHVLAQSAPFGPGSVRVALTMGDLELCGSLALSGEALRAALCAHGAAGRLVGEGIGYQASTSAAFPWFAAGGGARIGGVVGGRWHWGVRSVVLIPLREQTFSVQNAGVAYGTSSVAAAVDLVMGVRIF